MTDLTYDFKAKYIKNVSSMAVLTYGFKAEDIIKENRITRGEIDFIRRWVESQRGIPRLIDEQIINFVLSVERDLELTKKTIIAYYKSRRETPEFFNDRDLAREDVQHQLRTLLFTAFPKRTPDGCLVLYQKFKNAYYDFDLDVSKKILIMTMDAALYTYPPTGLIFIFDLEGLTLSHLFRFKIFGVRAFFRYLQEGLPVKLKAIHGLNTVSFINKFMVLFKPFLKPHIYTLLHFHDSSLNMEDFYEKYIPKECLPVNYGGKLPDVQTLHEENIVKLREMKEFFDAEERQRQNI